jgi:hypothetical protein
MLVVGVVLLAGLVLTASVGSSATKPTPTEKKLNGQVATLQKQVKALQKQVKDLQNVVSGTLAINVCSAAITADALQGTWAAVNAREQSAGLLPIFPVESAVNDASACTAAKVTRTPTANPPNLTAFKALLSIFSAFG